MKAFTYAASGVNRRVRAKSKKFGFLEASMPSGWKRTPFNNLTPINGKYSLLTVDGVGTKIFVAELAEKKRLTKPAWRVHEGIGVDAVATVVNDCVRCGARPVTVADTIDIAHSEPKRVGALVRGFARGARFAGAAVAGGETADVREMIAGIGSNPYLVNASCFAVVERGSVIDGSRIKPGDAVVGLRSTGFHANGLSLARRVLFKEWGGLYDAAVKLKGFKRPLALEVLEPTRIYTKNVLAAMRAFDVRGAFNVTGDAYEKFSKFTPFCGCGFEFDYFKPQRVFSLVQSAASELGGCVTKEEMFRTFNMGWGFALVVPEKQADALVSFLKKHGEAAAVIGRATKNKGVVVHYEGEKIVLK